MTRRHKKRLVVTILVGIPVGLVLAFLWWLFCVNTLTGYARRGEIGHMRLCLLCGIDPNKPERWGFNREYDGETPLSAAAFSGQVEAVRLLLDHGANTNLRDSGVNFPGKAPLASAAIVGHVEICRMLINAGADPNIACEPGSGGWTALDWALQAKQPEAAAFLRQHGALESGRRGVGP